MSTVLAIVRFHARRRFNLIDMFVVALMSRMVGDGHIGLSILIGSLLFAASIVAEIVAGVN